MSNSKQEYKQILKATSLFGGVQVFNILIVIVRSKVIAILLGPTGMGIAGMFNSTIRMIGMLTNFGLGISAVKDIAEAHRTSDEVKISKIVAVFRKLVWGTGLLGAIVTLILSPWLSQLTFGNNKYTLGFIWLSVTLLFKQLTSSQNVLLQGMRKLRYLAEANIISATLGLVVSFPIYYYWRLDGIVPALLITSFITLFVAIFYARKIQIQKVSVSNKEILIDGKSMLKMGFMLSLSGFITLGASYIVRIYISNTGGLNDVGLYTAGFSIIGTYVGLIFSAMGTDYYPRLSAVTNDETKTNNLINQQAEIGILIIAPILTVFLIFINWIIIGFYSSKFVPINGMIHWAALGMYFKSVSWAIGFILLAKGASKLFFWSELISNAYMLLFNILGYKYGGLNGLGISFFISYILVLLQVYFIAYYNFNFKLKKELIKLFVQQFILGLMCFLIIELIDGYLVYFIGLIFIVISGRISYIELDKKINLKEIFINLKKRQ